MKRKKITKPSTSKARKFYIKVPVEAKNAAEERRIKADAKKSFKGTTFTKR